MLLLYNFGVQLYNLYIYLASFFNQKAKLWVEGRKKQVIAKSAPSIWFHFASLGEFEQGRPVLEQMRNLYPAKKIIVTFFSPSGYEIRKNTPLADVVYYLPIDNEQNARNFIEKAQPEMAVFTKYEYWYHYFKELDGRRIPLYIISGIFRPSQVFFKWYGGLHREILSFVTRFFVQDEVSVQLLKTIGLTNATLSGDTRFDRVWANAKHSKTLPIIENFKNGAKVFIAGSTWPPDEELLVALITQFSDWKFIIAPHEIGEDKIDRLMAILPNESIRYSQILNLKSQISNQQILIIDNIGMLSSLYKYGDIAYIGGGFGAGIHNTLEAAAFGLPVIFGPEYAKFKEAKDLIELDAGFSINNVAELKQATANLVEDIDYYNAASSVAKKYVEEHIGATSAIVDFITARPL